MSAKKFKFVSPGIFLNEIDQSQLPAEPREIGPMVIGRTQRGSAMRPVQVDSFADFVALFGEPHPGGATADVWRDGGNQAPTYAAYAAQAWLKNSSTLNVVRLLGTENANKSAGGDAGWKTSGSIGTNLSDGGAYGMWVFPGELSGSSAISATGSLAAVWYLESGSVGLVGTDPNNVAVTDGKAKFVQSDASGNFTVKILASGTTYENVKFNMDTANSNFIRKVFNTNPTLTNADITDSPKNYWLGETYENDFDANISSSGDPWPTVGKYVGIILGIASGSQHSNRQIPFENSTGTRNNPATGWFIPQNLNDTASYSPSTADKLFRVHALDHGEWAQRNLKISITNLKYSYDEHNKYGTFDVLVRDIEDTDKNPVVLERYSGCNLNKSSEDFVGRRIGNAHVEYSAAEKRLIEKGEHPNNSKYIRVEMGTNYAANAEYLPFGVFGPPVYKSFTFKSSSFGDQWVEGTGVGCGGGAGSLRITSSASDRISGYNHTGSSYEFIQSKVALRTNASDGTPSNVTDSYFGAWTNIGTGDTFNKSVLDHVSVLGATTTQLVAGDDTEYSWIFSLDNVSSSATDYIYVSGSHVLGNSVTAVSGTYKDLIKADVDSFTTLLHGGSDGINITEKQPFRNGLLATKAAATHYAFNSIQEAIDLVRDPEVAEHNLVTVPGMYHEGLTSYLIDMADSRGDTLAIVDLDGDFVPEYENSTGKPTYRSSVSEVVSNKKDRGLNSSYGCAYYPWVQVRDTLQGSFVYMPPSVVALGAMSHTDRVRAPWFAPAGFNRGGLSSGAAGLPVVNVTQKLTSKDRDKLYDVNINPIATFPNEGIVIFGQKTLQVTRSALDRINVRRLLLYVKKGISTLATDVLFEPNVQETWDRFINRAEPFLSDVKSRFGLTEYKLILDKTTTTPDLIDQNVMYAKVFLKPARAIEFIAVDFIITNTGASFED